MDPSQELTSKTARLTAFVEPLLSTEERVTTVLALGVGPLSPLTVLVPLVGVVLNMTRWIRSYGIVLTNERFLLVRVRKWGSTAKPQSLDDAAPLRDVTVLSWTARRSAGLLTLNAGGRRLRLWVVDKYHLQMPSLLEELRYESP